VDSGSREENAMKHRHGAFSSEVDSGSREENAMKHRHGAFEVDGNPPKMR
jgi:hypothetical protein